MEDARWIAERRLVAIERATGARSPITLRIAAPEPWGDDGAAAGCRVEIAGLLENVIPVISIDDIHALQQACKFLDDYLMAKRDVLDVQFPTGEPYERCS